MIQQFATAGVLIAPSSPLNTYGYVPGMSLAAQHFNYYLGHLTAELNSVLTATGASYNASDDTQVVTAIKALIGNSVVVSGTTAYSMPASGYTRFLVAVPTGSASAVFNVPSAASIIGSAITVVNITSSGSGSGLVQVKANGADVWESTGSATMWLGSPWTSITFEAVAAGRLKVLAGTPVPDQGIDTGGRQARYALGRLIHLPLDNTTDRTLTASYPALSNWSSAIQAAGVAGIPAGAKAVRVKVTMGATFNTSATGLWEEYFSDNVANTPSVFTSHPLARFMAYGGSTYTGGIAVELDVPLNSLGQFFIYTATLGAQLTPFAFEVAAVGYYTGD